MEPNNGNRIKKLFPGVLLTFGLTYIAKGLFDLQVAILLTDKVIPTLAIAVLLGVWYKNYADYRPRAVPGIEFCGNKLLKFGVVLLGLKVDLPQFMESGPLIIMLVVVIILFAISFAYFIGPKMGLNSKLATLLGCGSALCGASAIVAIGSVIKADDEDIAIGVSVVTVMGTIGIFLYVLLEQFLPLTDSQFGLLVGASLQDVAHVVAAAPARGGMDGDAMSSALLIKMVRVSLLGIVAIILGILFTQPDPETGKRGRVKFPAYVIGFLTVAGLYSLNNFYGHPVPTEFDLLGRHIDVIATLKHISKICITVAMAAVGLKVNLVTFREKGVLAFKTCSVIFTCVLILASALLYLSVHIKG